jgi:hypothetical protein
MAPSGRAELGILALVGCISGLGGAGRRFLDPARLLRRGGQSVQRPHVVCSIKGPLLPHDLIELVKKDE